MVASLSDKFNLAKFIVKSKFFSFGKAFQILDDSGKNLFGARMRKGFCLVEHYDVLEFDSAYEKKQVILTIKREKLFQIGFHYCLLDSNGMLIAKIKQPIFSMVMELHIFNPSGIVIGKVVRNVGKWGVNFDIYYEDHKIGSCNKKSLLLDEYAVDLTNDPGKLLDRWVALGLAIVIVLVEQYSRRN